MNTSWKILKPSVIGSIRSQFTVLTNFPDSIALYSLLLSSTGSSTLGTYSLQLSGTKTPSLVPFALLIQPFIFKLSCILKFWLMIGKDNLLKNCEMSWYAYKLPVSTFYVELIIKK